MLLLRESIGTSDSAAASLSLQWSSSSVRTLLAGPRCLRHVRIELLYSRSIPAKTQEQDRQSQGSSVEPRSQTVDEMQSKTKQKKLAARNSNMHESQV
jgi:hypothetical protein